MKISRPNSKPVSAEDLKNLEKLQTLIKRSVADGKLSQDEMETIKTCMSADGKITSQELELCQHLIWDKINTGELMYDWTEQT